MDIRYTEGDHKMTVFGEIMANLKAVDVDMNTFGRWDSPHESEPIDQAHRKLVLDRIVTAMAYVRLVVSLIGRVRESPDEAYRYPGSS